MIKTFLIGILVGVCNIIPGVSGGTLVVIFDIYDQFMDITSLRFKKIISNWKFSVPLVVGMAFGILIFSKLISIMYVKYPIQNAYFFTGLILGSIPLMFNYSYRNESDKNRTGVKLAIQIVCTLVGIAIIVGFTLLQKKYSDVNTVYSELPKLTLGLAVKLFIGGIVGAVAMIIPGISGALLLLIMGVYPIIIAAIPVLLNVGTFVQAFLILFPAGIGILVGLVGGSNVLKYLLKRYPGFTYAVIFGLILGSIMNIFPGFSFNGSVITGIVSFVCLICGALLAFFSSRFAVKDKSNEIAEIEEKETDIQE